jgi:cytochrome c oxidase subunit IV
MLDHAEGIRVVYKGLRLLAIVTLVEVAIALVGNGHIIHGFHLSKWIMYPVMIILSLYKAYFIVYEFMHMKYEVPGLAKSVLMPTLLLVWGIIAFFYEGGAWRNNRREVQKRDKSEVEAPKPTSFNTTIQADVKQLF